MIDSFLQEKKQSQTATLTIPVTHMLRRCRQNIPAIKVPLVKSKAKPKTEACFSLPSWKETRTTRWSGSWGLL